MARWMRLVLTVVVLAATIAAPAWARTELTMWYHSGQAEERAVLLDQVARFNAAHPDIFIRAVEIPEGSYNEQVQAAALAGDLPDILDLDGPMIANYVWAGMLLPLDDFVSPELKSDLLPSILAQGTYEGRLYALGVFDAGLGIWGNRRYLEDVGARIPQSVEDAWTFTEFMDVLDRLKAHPEVRYPLDFKVNYGVGEWFTFGFSPIFQAFGADLIDRSTMDRAQGVVNGPAARAAGAWLQSLFELGYANPNPPGDTEFIDGSAALSWVGHWMWPQYSSELGDDLVLLPMPKFMRQVTGTGSWAWSITRNAADPAAAWKFIEFLLQPEEIVKMTDANGAVPSRLSAARMSANYQPGGPLSLYVEQLQTIGLERPVTPAYPAISAYFAEAIDNIIHGAPVGPELDRVAENIEMELAFMGLR